MAKNIVQYILEIVTKDATGELKDVSKGANKLEKDLDNAKKSGVEMAADIGSAVTGLKSGLSLLSGGLNTITTALKDAVEGAFEFNRAVVDSINDLNDLNAQSALSAESIQAVKVAFEGSGQSAEAAAAFISRFPRLMADLEAGAGRATEAASKLGISIRDLGGNMRSSDDILKDAISSLQQIENDTERSTTAFLLFGRSAGQLLQAFAKTSNFENFLALSNEFGVKTGPEASNAAAKFQELLAALNVVAAGTRQAFVEAVGGIDFFNAILIGTLKLLASVQVVLTENQDQIGRFSNSLIGIGQAAFEVFQSLLQSLQSFIGASVAFMVNRLLLPLAVLNTVGAISDETFEKVLALGDATTAAGFALEGVVEGVNDTADQGVSTAKRVEELVNGILAGITLTGNKLTGSMEGVEDSLKGATAAADDFTFSFSGEDEAALDRLNQAMETIDNSFREFKPLTVAAEQATEQVRLLQDAVEYYEELGLDTTLAQELLNTAREKEQEALKELRTSLQDATLDFSKLGETVSGVINGISDPSSAVGGVGTAISNVGGLVGGRAGTALAAAAPIIGAVGAVVVALESLGQSTPKELEAKFDDFIKNFERGARILPTLIADILPKFVGELLIAIGTATINLAFQIPRAILDGLSEFTFEFMDQLGDALFGWLDRIKEFFNNFGDYFSNIFSREGRRENRQRILGFESGGRFSSSGIQFTGADQGLAMLHRGEYIVPESNRRSQAVDRTMNAAGGGGVNIVINAEIVEQSAIDELVRKIEQRFQGFGGGRSTLFGV